MMRLCSTVGTPNTLCKIVTFLHCVTIKQRFSFPDDPLLNFLLTTNLYRKITMTIKNAPISDNALKLVEISASLFPHIHQKEDIINKSMTELQNDLLILSTVISEVATEIDKSVINSEWTEHELHLIKNNMPYSAS